MADESKATSEGSAATPGGQSGPEGAAATETSKAAAAGAEAGPESQAGDGPAGGAAYDATTEAPANPWESIDPVLDAFAAELQAGVGTLCGESWLDTVGRFLGWTNSAGWRCLLRLLHEPKENVVLVVAEGPPLPGGRARALPLAQLPLGFDPQELRAGLVNGLIIAETWGPAEETGPEAPSEAAAASAAGDDGAAQA